MSTLTRFPLQNREEKGSPLVRKVKVPTLAAKNAARMGHPAKICYPSGAGAGRTCWIMRR